MATPIDGYTIPEFSELDVGDGSGSAGSGAGDGELSLEEFSVIFENDDGTYSLSEEQIQLIYDTLDEAGNGDGVITSDELNPIEIELAVGDAMFTLEVTPDGKILFHETDQALDPVAETTPGDDEEHPQE